jgi:hypothetical protein
LEEGWGRCSERGKGCRRGLKGLQGRRRLKERTELRGWLLNYFPSN